MIRRGHASLLLQRTSFLGIILGSTATLVFVAGLAGHLESALLHGATVAVLLLAALFLFYVFFFHMWSTSRVGFLCCLLILAILVIQCVLGLVPPAARDELTHHLALPRLYLNAGRIIEVPFAPYSYYPMLLDMLYTPFIKWHFDSVPKMIHGLFGFLTGALLYSYLALRLNPTYGLLAALFYVSTPAILRLSNLAYVDLALTFYSTASLLCLLRWKDSDYARVWLILAGLSAGFALATKPNGLLVFFLLFLLAAFQSGGGRKVRIGKVSSDMILFLILAVMPYGPWALKNLYQTGNPFFPLFGAFFDSGGGGGHGEGSLGVFTRRHLLYGESGWQMALLPLRIFFFGQDDSPQQFDGVLNPMLVVFLPWAFKGKWREEKRVFFWFAAFYFLYALFQIDLRIRYVLPIVPPLVVLLVYGLHNVYLRITRPFLLVGAVTLLLALNVAYLGRYFRAVSPIDYVAGRESREDYLTRKLPEYPAIQYINRNLPPKARIYFILTGRRVYHCQRDYFHDPGDNPWYLVQAIRNAESQEGIKARLMEKGLTHLLIRVGLLKRFLNDNLSPEKRLVWNRFVARHLNRLFTDQGYSVYHVHD